MVSSDLKDKRVIVTAAASGIGQTIARSFLDAGARVHACDLDEKLLKASSRNAPELGTTQADVADPAQVDQLFDDAIARLGGLDILVNNAGIAGPVGPIETLDPEGWNRTIAVNLTGHFLCARRAVPLLKQAGGGSIVNLSSTAGLYGCPNRTPYASSKWGVIGLTKTLAMELGTFGIRVNAICPGCVAGERIERVIRAEAETRGIGADEVRTSYLRQSSMRIFVEQDDVANLVLFICSDRGAKISGQALTVDGHTETLTV